jgi:hypothetical protein
MKWIAHQSKFYIFALKQYHQFPEIGMKDRVAAGNIEIRHSVVDLTKIFTIRHNFLHLLPGHTFQFLATGSGKNITMLTALVTLIRNMPLKCKILTHPILPPVFPSFLTFLTCQLLRKNFRKQTSSVRHLLHKRFRKLLISSVRHLLHKRYRKLHLLLCSHSILQCLLMPFLLPPIKV